jgi:hypothetical protein
MIAFSLANERNFGRWSFFKIAFAPAEGWAVWWVSFGWMSFGWMSLRGRFSRNVAFAEWSGSRWRGGGVFAGSPDSAAAAKKRKAPPPALIAREAGKAAALWSR